MDGIRTQARLVDLGASGFATRGLSVVVPRSEIEEAIYRGEYPARLALDVARVADERSDVTTQVAVDWEEAELKEVLRTTGEGDVTLWFDAGELERALEEPDVDAHGLRERAAVLAVAAAAVGATAGGAFAHTGFVSDVASGGTGQPAAVSLVSDVASGGTGEPAAVSLVSDVASGGTGEPAATSSFVSDVASGGTGQPAAVSLVSDVASGGTGEPAATSSFVSDVASGGTGEAAATSSFVSDVASGGTGQPATAPGSGSEISLPSPAESAGIAAGVVLLISGAGFVAARSRTRPPRQA